MLRALKLKNIDRITAENIVISLSGVVTKIKTKAATSAPIVFRGGVRQGDPLSPVLFNLVISELIWHLDGPNEGGTICKDAQVTVIAFADDIALLTDDPVDMIPLVAMVEEFLKNRRMTINPKKSVVLVRKRRSGRGLCLYTKLLDRKLLKQQM